MSWKNNDGLYIKYGVEKAVATTAGDYLSYGETREIELDVNVADLTTSAKIMADTTFVPADMVIDSVTVFTVTPVATITSLSIGLTKLDRTTAVSDTAFVAALPVANMSDAGETTNLTGGVTYAGAKVGTTVGTDPGYITAKIAGTVGTGVVKVRIRYRGVPPITH